MTLNLPVEPNSYGAETRPPAPAWLISATPGAPALAEKLADATEAAREKYAAYSASIRAFREASYHNADAEWAPLAGTPYDKWRDLRGQMDALRVEAEYRSPAPVERAWHALRDHLAASPEALSAAVAEAQLRHDVAQAEAARFAPLVAAWREAANLVGGVTTPEFAALSRAADAYLAPQDRRPWRTVHHPMVSV